MSRPPSLNLPPGTSAMPAGQLPLDVGAGGFAGVADAVGVAGFAPPAPAAARGTTSTRSSAPQPSGGDVSLLVALVHALASPSWFKVSRCDLLLPPAPAPATSMLAAASASAPAKNSNAPAVS